MSEEVIRAWAGFYLATPLSALPFKCGFLGKNNLNDGVRMLAQELGRPICLLKQVHGTRLIELRQIEAKNRYLTEAGDGFLFNLSELAALAVVVQTADCLPIILCGENYGALIHAGWRGLLSGIITEAVDWLAKYETDIQCVIGPHAGADHYEVGHDVWASFTERARGEILDGKYLLNLAAIATLEVEKKFPNTAVEVIPISTMTDARFYSYRREKQAVGRNLTFVTAF